MITAFWMLVALLTLGILAVFFKSTRIPLMSCPIAGLLLLVLLLTVFVANASTATSDFAFGLFHIFGVITGAIVVSWLIIADSEERLISRKK